MATLAGQTLFQHIKNTDVSAIHHLLHTTLNINIDERDRDGQTFLMVASQMGSTEVVTLLLDNPAVDVNAVDDDNWSALLNASKEGHLEVVVQLTDKNADLEHKDVGGWTALIWACYKNKIDVVAELLDRGSNANIRGEHNMSCLTWASGRGYAEIARLLLLQGAKPNTADKYGTTPLMWAARKGHKQIVDYLLEEGATIDNAGMNSWTALIMAAKGGYTEVVASLLEYYPNINAVDKDSYTALTHAAKEGYVEIAKMLLDKGAYVNRPDRYGDTILIHAAKGGHTDVLKTLLKKHADVDVQGVDEKTALYWAVEKSHPVAVKMMLDANANCETANKDGDTPLLKAVRGRNVEATQLLLEKGAKVSATDKKGDNALHIAVRGRSKRVSELLLRNPKDGRLLYRPNKNGETPYQIDAEHEKKILTQVFGARNLNADDNIEGYELYSSTIADVLSEPSLNTPITVGLYAKWGSGKSFLIKKLIKEMKNFTRHNMDTMFEFSALQFFVSFVPSLLIGVIIALAFRWEAGLGIGLGIFFLQYMFLGIMWVGSVKKDWSWAYYMSVGFAKKMGMLRLLLQVMFCNEPTIVNRETAAVKFLFTDNARLASVVGEKSITAMIGTLCDSLEQEYGTLGTRWYKVLKPAKASENGRFKSLCCIPYFLIVLFVFCCIITVAALLYAYGPRNVFDSDITTVDGIVIAILVVIGLAILGNIYTWSCMIINLAVPPRKRVQKIMSSNDSLKMEGLIQNLKKEVELLGHMTRCMDAFRHTHTRLVVIVDGLDSCEQERLLQVLDTVHMLFSDDRSPFVTILAVDPHVIIKGIEHNLQGLFRDSSINGHDYLRNLVQLPFFLQSQTMPKTRYSIARPDRAETGPSTPANTRDHDKPDKDAVPNHITVTYHKQDSTVSTISIPDLSKHSKKKRSPQHAAVNSSGPNLYGSSNLVSHTSQQDLSKSIGKSSYFSDINPRSMKRMMNIIAVTGRLLRACNVDFNWYKLAAWINITEQWPYRLSWIILEVENNEQIQENMPLKNIYESIVPKLPSSKEVDPRLEIDRNERKLEVFLQNSRPMLTVGDLKKFMLCTINVDPYLRKLIKEQLQNAENLSFDYGMYPANTASFDPFGWPYPVRRPPSRAEMSPRATPTRAASAMRLGIMGGTPGPYPSASTMMNPYGMYPPPPHMHYAPAITQNQSSPSLMNISRASPRINVQGGFPNDSLSTMSVDEVCGLLSRLDGLDKSKLRNYMVCFQEHNISGPVLLTCELTDLKPVLQMTFGDWELFRSLVQTLREREVTFDAVRNQDPNSSVDDAMDDVQSPKLKFTQDMQSLGAGVSVPQPNYPMGLNLQGRKNLSEHVPKNRDPTTSDNYRSKSAPFLKKYPGSRLNVAGGHQTGYYSVDVPHEAKGMLRKDSFFGEVMLENAALRSVVEAVGVNTDTGDDTDDDVHRSISPVPEERPAPKRQHSIKGSGKLHKGEQSKAKSNHKEQDPRYRLGDSESADSDSEEVVLLARKASSKMSSRGKSPSNLPKLKLNSLRSMNLSSDSLSGVSKDGCSSGKVSRASSKEALMKIVADTSVPADYSPTKRSQRLDPVADEDNDQAPLLHGERIELELSELTIHDEGQENQANQVEDQLESPTYAAATPCTEPNTEIESVFNSMMSPTQSCEHLALRKMSESESICAPSAFKTVTPSSSRASSRASSLGLSLISSRAISVMSVEGSIDGMRLSISESADANFINSASVSRRSSRKISPVPSPDVHDSVTIEMAPDSGRASNIDA